ncbi:MAG TPA: NAD(P)-dependent oxidoreductase [Kiritimatiellia bacterium]|jgi:uroporphyrin-III C-methyltransferase/precorrin-2 dehydrogenase/sirohydrochlorin ferrochelatase
MKAFPIAWVTSGRKLLIIGGGPETEVRLTHALLFDWAKIRLIVARVPDILRGRADARVEFIERAATEADVAEADLVLEDSGSRETAENVRAWCDRHHVPLNATDKPDLCDFYYMSLLLRDPLVIGIASGGDAPAVSAALRKVLNEKVGPGWSAAAALLAGVRESLPGGQARIDLLRKIARHEDFVGHIEKNDMAALQRLVEHELRSL